MVVEIGPGQGALTRLIAPQVKRLICVETDRDLIEPLRSGLPASVEIVHADFLKWDMGHLPSRCQSHRQYSLLYFHTYYREINYRQNENFSGFFDRAVGVWTTLDGQVRGQGLRVFKLFRAVLRGYKNAF